MEAFASSLPVVSTPVGVGGLGIKKGVQALVSSDMDKISDMTVQLLKDKKKARKIGKAGRDFVKENYDWKKIVNRLDRVYQKIAQ